MKIKTLAVAALLLAAPALRAEHGPSHGGFKEKLRLTDEQEKKLKAAQREKRDALQVVMAERRAAANKLKDLLEDKAPEKDLAAALEKVEKSRKDARAIEDKFEAAVKGALTVEQRAKMASHMGMGGGMMMRKHVMMKRHDGNGKGKGHEKEVEVETESDGD